MTLELTKGSPPIWIDKPTPFQLKQDRGQVYVDQNGSRLPNMPLLPLFQAIDYSQPLDWPSIDFVTDRRNLRDILAWACGSNKSFRIDTQLAGQKTVLFCGWTPRAKVTADGKSFGHSFEKEATRSGDGLEDSSSHHRMIVYVSPIFPAPIWLIETPFALSETR
jgi:hypothetical protein